MNTLAAITKFGGEFRFLSNFFPCLVTLVPRTPDDLPMLTYPSVEHAFQAAKSLDYATRLKIQASGNAAIAKKKGRAVVLRADWEQVKVAIMRQLLYSKFINPDLRRGLIATGDAFLIEGNTWGDEFWGAVEGDGFWRGNNALGKLLMEVRSAVRHYEEAEIPFGRGRIWNLD